MLIACRVELSFPTLPTSLDYKRKNPHSDFSLGLPSHLKKYFAGKITSYLNIDRPAVLYSELINLPATDHYSSSIWQAISGGASPPREGTF